MDAINAQFRCPKCGGKYWGTLDLDACTVECHADGCGWTGHRNECGLTEGNEMATKLYYVTTSDDIDMHNAALPIEAESWEQAEAKAGPIRSVDYYGDDSAVGQPVTVVIRCDGETKKFERVFE